MGGTTTVKFGKGCNTGYTERIFRIDYHGDEMKNYPKGSVSPISGLWN